MHYMDELHIRSALLIFTVINTTKSKTEWLQCRQNGTVTDDAIVPSIVLCSYLCYFLYVIQLPVWQFVFECLKS